MTDAELLGAYASRQDESAFGELMRRHGALVYRACHRLLKDTHAAEDASQAVFVVLARKAGGLTKGDLSAWLYRVAHLVAAEIVRKRMRRTGRETAYAVNEAIQTDTGTSEEVADPALLGMVDTALLRLHEPYREAVILRYLKNHSVEDASRLAGCSVNAMAVRTHRGIEQLRRQLGKRGMVASAIALTGLLTSEASAAVPETLLPSILATVKSAAATTATATTATSTAAMLAKGAMKAMFIAKVKMVAAIAAAVVVTGTVVPVGIAASFSAGSSNHTVTNAHDAAVVRPEPAPRAPVTNGDTNGFAITAKSSEVDNITHCAVFEGDVHVITAQFTMTADRMLAFRENTNQLRRIEAFGNVVFRQPERQVTCDKAVYEKADGKVTLTGKTVLTATTVVTRGKDSITASELVIDLNDNHVTASGGSKVQVHP